MKRFIPVLVAVISILAGCHKTDKTPSDKNPPNTPVDLKDSVLVEGLNFPWEIVWAPDNYIWMTQRGGTISRVDPTTGVVTTVLTVSEVDSRNEGGMLGMVFHPDFIANHFVYVAYDYTNSGSYKGKVVRFEYENGALIHPTTIIDNINANNNHN